MKEIYQQTVEEVLERVNGKKSGLTSEQVKRSREKCGWNELTEGKKKGILQIFFEEVIAELRFQDSSFSCIHSADTKRQSRHNIISNI